MSKQTDIRLLNWLRNLEGISDALYKRLDVLTARVKELEHNTARLSQKARIRQRRER